LTKEEGLKQKIFYIYPNKPKKMAIIKLLDVSRLLRNLSEVPLLEKIILIDTNVWYPPEFINLETGHIDGSFDKLYNELLVWPHPTQELRPLLKQFYQYAEIKQQFLMNLTRNNDNVFLIPEVVEELQVGANYFKRLKRKIVKSRKSRKIINFPIYKDYWKRCFSLAERLLEFSQVLDRDSTLDGAFREEENYHRLFQHLRYLKSRNQKRYYNSRKSNNKYTDEALVTSAFIISDLFTGNSHNGYYPVRILSNDSDIEFLISHSQSFVESVGLKFDIGSIKLNPNGTLEETCFAYSSAA